MLKPYISDIIPHFGLWELEYTCNSVSLGYPPIIPMCVFDPSDVEQRQEIIKLLSREYKLIDE